MLPLSSLDVYIMLAFMPLLIAAGYSDLRLMRIPNSLSIAGLVLFAATLPLLGLDAWLLRGGAGLFAFLICFGLFAIGWFGGGDAKLLPVTFLFVPPSQLSAYLFAFAFSMILGMTLIWIARRFLSHPQAGWVAMQPNAQFPMGISIAASMPLSFLVGPML